MELKIYFDSNYIILTDCKNTKNIECNDTSDVISAISKIESQELTSIELYNKDFQKLFSMFTSEYRYIEAAGGVVENENAEYLFIYRNDKWDLPKGKLEKNETPEKAAIREVQEETGLQKVTLGTYICSTWHTYPHKKGKVLKQTFWYNMTASKNQEIAPQLEEGITELRWIAKDYEKEIIKNTYPSIIDVIMNK